MPLNRSGDAWFIPVQEDPEPARITTEQQEARRTSSGGNNSRTPRRGAVGGVDSGENRQARTSEQRIPVSSVSHQPQEKLRGRDDYAAWAFGMRMVMIKEGTWTAINPPYGMQVSDEMSQRALATICLSIERYNYSLVQNARTAKDAWKSLQTAFQDSGKYRKISLLRKLMRMELEDCSSVEEYVDEILTTSQKLLDIGFPIDDEWLSLVLMMGLPKKYEPMIIEMDCRLGEIENPPGRDDRWSRFWSFKRRVGRTTEPHEAYEEGQI